MAHGPSCSAACGILPDQGSNPCPLHWQADSQPLRHQGSPNSLYFDRFFMFSLDFYVVQCMIMILNFCSFSFLRVIPFFNGKSHIPVLYYLFIYLSGRTVWQCGILVPWPGIEPVAPAVQAWSPNDWTAREVSPFNFKSFSPKLSFPLVVPSLSLHHPVQWHYRGRRKVDSEEDIHLPVVHSHLDGGRHGLKEPI